MPHQSQESLHRPNRIRSEFDTRAFMVHHSHVQDGRKVSAFCKVCRKGVTGLVAPIQAIEPANEVPESSGMDETETGPPSPNSW